MMKNKYTVISNDDELKYQVIERENDIALYEHDSKLEAKTVCELMNNAYYELLERVAEKSTDALQDVFEISVSSELKGNVDKLVFDKEHEETFVSVMAKEFTLQMVKSIVDN